MTIGSETLNLAVSQGWTDEGYYAGQNAVGRYKYRSWSGTDTPSDRMLAIDLADGTAVRYTDHRGKERYYRSSFRPAKRARRLEEHPYSMVAFDEVLPSTTITLMGDYGGPRTYQGVNPFRLCGGYFTPIAPVGGNTSANPVWDANDEIKLINKLKVAVRGSDFNMGVFLGEGHETLRMISSAALTIAGSLRLLRKGDVLGATRLLLKHGKPLYRGRVNTAVIRRGAVDQLSSNWLILVWGWMPLLEDIRAGAELLAHTLNVPFEQRIRVAGRKRAALGGDLFEAAGRNERRRQIIAILRERESIPKLTGLLDPLSVAWELTPFSMLVDYVVPIGSWLEARSFASGLDGKFVITEKRVLEIRDLKFGKTYERVAGYPSYYVGDPKGAYIRHTTLDRVVTTSLSVPKPKVKPLAKIFSVRHCLNALALLAQVAKGPLKSNDDKLLTSMLDSNPTRKQWRSELKAGDTNSFLFL